jgi:hypothetical protein
VKKYCQRTALATALAAFIASAALFLAFLSHGDVSGRAIIPPAQMQHTDGFRYIWRVPSALRAAPWYRAEVRIFEDGKPLPLRVEEPESVSNQGNGRFGVSPFSVGDAQREFVWFSASHNSNPATNGRKYEFEMRRTVYRLAILSMVSLAFAVMASLIAVPAGIWSRIVEVVAKPGDGRVLLLRRLAICLAVLALVTLAQVLPSTRIVVPIRLAAGQLIQSEDHFFYRLPRWIDQGAALEYGTLYEDGKPMKRSSRWAWQSADERGTFYCSSDDLTRVCFRTYDGSNPTLNGHTCMLKVPPFPIRFAPRLGTLLALMSLLLYAFAAELAPQRFPPVSMRTTGLWMAQFWRSVGWRLVMLGVGIAKLWVVAGAEVFAERFDAHGYAMVAIDPARLIWGSYYDGMPSHPTGFPLIAGLVGQLGVPWRLALEVLYLVASAGLAVVMGSLLRSRLISVAFFAAMAWHPWTLSGFGMFLSDPALLLFTVAAFALMIHVLGYTSANWRWGQFLAMGMILFIWDWSRREEPLVYCTYSLFAAAAWALSLHEANPMPRLRRIATLALPIIMVFVLGTAFRIANYFHYGIYAKSEISAPGLTELMTALYKIKPERDFRYAAVTRQSLMAACQASVTLRQFQDKLLDPQAEQTRINERVRKTPGEFAGLLDFLLLSSFPPDQRLANEIMLRSASEINDALNDGRLPRRSAFYPLNPAWRLWLPDLVPCVFKSLRNGMSVQKWPGGDSNDPELENDFDKAANRRYASTHSPLLLIQGSVQSPFPLMDSVAVMDQRGKLLTASPLFSNSVGGATRFYLRCPLPKEALSFNLLFLNEGKSRFAEKGHESSWWATNRYSTVTNITVLPGAGEMFNYSYTLTMAEFDKKVRMELWEPRTETICKVLYWSAVLATLSIVLFRESWEKARFRRVLACMFLAVGWLLGRAALYGLLEANFGWSDFGPDRFMCCISPLFILILVLTAGISSALLKSFLHKPAFGVEK